MWTFSVLDDQIYEMKCPFVAVGVNAHFIVLPRWGNLPMAVANGAYKAARRALT